MTKEELKKAEKDEANRVDQVALASAMPGPVSVVSTDLATGKVRAQCATTGRWADVTPAFFRAHFLNAPRPEIGSRPAAKPQTVRSKGAR